MAARTTSQFVVGITGGIIAGLVVAFVAGAVTAAAKITRLEGRVDSLSRTVSVGYERTIGVQQAMAESLQTLAESEPSFEMRPDGKFVVQAPVDDEAVDHDNVLDLLEGFSSWVEEQRPGVFSF